MYFSFCWIIYPCIIISLIFWKITSTVMSIFALSPRRVLRPAPSAPQPSMTCNILIIQASSVPQSLTSGSRFNSSGFYRFNSPLKSLTSYSTSILCNINVATSVTGQMLSMMIFVSPQNVVKFPTITAQFPATKGNLKCM